MTVKNGKICASKVTCPECNHRHMRYSNIKYTDTERIRYRFCPSCGHRLRTIQPLDPPMAPEQIVPFIGKGEGRYNAKLKDFEVRDIRRMYKNGVFSQVELALQYGVDKCTISQACCGRSWANI